MGAAIATGAPHSDNTWGTGRFKPVKRPARPFDHLPSTIPSLPFLALQYLCPCSVLAESARRSFTLATPSNSRKQPH